MDISNWRLLTVEDDPDAQSITAKLLHRSNLETDVAGTADEALRCLDQGNYTGLIIDLMLPDIDGWELLKRIRANEATATLPCIAVTAYNTSEVRHQAIDSGFNA